MQRDTLGLNKSTVANLFNRRKYIIPKYQRAYSWDKEKAEQLYTDLYSVEDGDYYLGNILLNSHETYYEVIDGQQRITTLALIFFAIYLHMHSIDSKIAERNFLIYLKGGSGINEYDVLTLSRHNKDFFSDLIALSSIEEVLEFLPDHTNKNLKEALDYFINKIAISKLSDINLEKVRLQQIFDKVSDRVFLIELVVTDYKEASHLFEALNNRGAELSEADLVRNYLLSCLEKQNFASDENIQIWNDIEDKIGLKNLERFLRYASFLFSDEKEIFTRVVSYIDSTSSKTTLDLLAKLADIYAFIENAEWQDKENCLENCYAELNEISATQVRSVLLAASFSYSEDEQLVIARECLNFNFKYFVTGKNPNKLEKKYSELANKIFNKKIQARTLLEELESSDIKVSEEEYRLAFLNKSFKGSKLPRYILIKLEGLVSTDEKMVREKRIDLEHILPQKPENWIKQDSGYKSLHKNCLNNIGNYVILSKRINSSIKNNVFDIKKESYRESQIVLLESIIKEEKWTEKEIKNNAQRYLELSLTIWPFSKISQN